MMVLVTFAKDIKQSIGIGQKSAFLGGKKKAMIVMGGVEGLGTTLYG